MGNLNNLYISQSFQSLAHLGTNTSLVPGTMTRLEDGIGQSLNISFDGTNISSSGNIYAANITASAVNTGSLVTTSSFNTYTSSTNVRLNNLESTSASVNVSIANLNAATSSYVTETESGSFLITASFDNGSRNLTFTKGNNTTFAVNIPDVSGSIIATGSLMVTGSVNLNVLTFTKGDGSTFDLTVIASGSAPAGTISSSAQIVSLGFLQTSSFNSYTASTDSSISQLNASSASQQVSINNLNTTTASLLIETQNLELFSASALVSISNLNQSSASQQVSINSLNAATASYVTETESGSFLITASFDNGTRNLTFTKGNNTTFAVNIPDVSGSAGNFVTTSSFNSYTSSNNQRVDSLESNSASVNTSITNINSFTQSANIRLNNLETTSASVNVSIANINSTTASQATSISNLNTFSASALVSINELNQNSASVNTSVSNINQFTQSAQISINSINAATSSYITESETASFARTNVDNNFTANQTFTNITAVSASFTYVQTLFETASVIYSSGSNQFGDELTDIQTLSGSVKVQGSLTVNGTPVLTSSVDISGLVTTASFNSYTQSNDQRVSSLEVNSASVNTSITNINTTTASLNSSISQLNASSASQQISIDALNTNSASVNTSITNINSATASLFTSASLALVTASASGNTITFTKGNSSTFSVSVDTGSAANTIFEVVYTGENITKGDPLYISGSQGANPIVFKADAADPNKMPVTFISNETIGASNTTDAIILGLIEGIDLTGYTANQAIYVAEGGGFSTSLPSGSNSITQLLGVVTKGGSGGKGLVLNPGPALLPGLDTGRMWVGNGSNQPIEITTASFASSASFNSYTSSNDQRVNSLEANSASVNTSITNINSATASLFTSVSALNTFTASQSTASLVTSIDNLNTFSASALVSISNLNASSASQQISINSLNGATGSYATTGSNSFTGSQTITGSITTTQDITVSGVKFGFGNSAGTASIAIGNSSTLQNNTDDNNIAIGNAALQQNTTGERNIGIGTEALKNITGNSSYNTAIGGYALSQATSSTNTFALGYAAMELAETSTDNTAIGVAALYRKKANSNSNTAIGFQALREHFDGDTHGGQNMAFGFDTMRYVTSGSANTAIGAAALRDAGRANENVFIGWISGINTSGSISQNVVIGPRAGQKIADSSNTIIGHNAGSEIVNGGTNIFIGQGAGAAIVTGSQNTLIGSIPGVDNWSNVIAIADGSSGIKTKFQSNIWEFTGSVDIQNTLTASLQEGYVWVGNSAGRTVTVATSSFGGGGGTTYINPTLNPYSGSLILVANTFTSSSFAHISASANGQVNLVFKNNNNTADTILSGSNNIFTNFDTPQTGFKRYIGGSNNIINTTNGPQRSGSMQFSPGFNANYYVGVLNMRGPVSSSAWNINNNIILGNTVIGTNATLNAEKLTAGLTMTGNSVAGNLNIVANQTALTGSTTNITNNNINGVVTLNLSSSAISLQQSNINDGGFNFTNQFSSGALGLGLISTSNNTIGGSSNTLIVTGSVLTGSAQPTIFNNLVIGSTNTGFINTLDSRISGASVYQSLLATSLLGNRLIVTGSSLGTDLNSFGSLFVGRWNANDGIRNKTSDVVFAVGTGISGSGTTGRKTGFLIDSGSNTFVEGTFNVSGSSTFTGSVNITGSLLVNGASVSINTSSFATTGSNQFNGNQTITGSLTMTGSILFVDRSGYDQNVYLGFNALGMGAAAGQPLAEGNTLSIAIGNGAMRFASGSGQNVAIGNNALLITTGSKNFALGSEALSSNTTGTSNVAIGVNALTNNIGGESNVVIGNDAGMVATGSSNTFIGSDAGRNISGSNNTILGRYQGTAGQLEDNNIILADGQGNVKAQYSGSNWALSGSIVKVEQVLQLGQLNPLPTGADGQLAVSASNLYFFSGSAWNRVSLA